MSLVNAREGVSGSVSSLPLYQGRQEKAFINQGMNTSNVLEDFRAVKGDSMGKAAAIIHTTSATIEELKNLLKGMMPELAVRNYLDESLLPEINQAGRVTENVRSRFFSLAQEAALAGPDAMICACSSLGELVEEARKIFPMPFLRIDEPMARQAARMGGSVMVCATLPSTLRPTLSLIRRMAGELHSDMQLESLLMKGAGELLAKGDFAGYDTLLQKYFLKIAQEKDMIVLAQASMARAAASLPEAYRGKFLTSPESGLQALVDLLSR